MEDITERSGLSPLRTSVAEPIKYSHRVFPYRKVTEILGEWSCDFLSCCSNNYLGLITICNRFCKYLYCH